VPDAAWVQRSDIKTEDGYVMLAVTDDKGNDYEFVMLVEQAAVMGAGLQGMAVINEMEDEA
jgi:hypothetical protein